MCDYGAIDREAPKKPTVIGSYLRFRVSAEDHGTQYYFYVESFDKENTTQSAVLHRSDVESLIVKTDIKRYYYAFDQSPTTVVTVDDPFTESSTIFGRNKTGFLHVAAMDGAGNLGETTTVPVTYIPITKGRDIENKKKRISLYLAFILIHSSKE